MSNPNAHPFEVVVETTVDATPEQVWQAITNGPAIDSWLMGTNAMEPRQGGTVRADFGGGAVMQSTITTWEPHRHLKYQSPEAPDGGLMAFEWLVEGRDGGRASIRAVHSGFLTGDAWQDEYNALRSGDAAYLQKLVQYLTHFAPRTATRNIFAPVPANVDKSQAWRAFYAAFGLSEAPAPGDAVRAQLNGLPAVEGVVDYVSPDFLGVLSTDSLYRFIHGYNGMVVVEHHIFGEQPDARESVENWQRWASQLLTPVAAG